MASKQSSPDGEMDRGEHQSGRASPAPSYDTGLVGRSSADGIFLLFSYFLERKTTARHILSGQRLCFFFSFAHDGCDTRQQHAAQLPFRFFSFPIFNFCSIQSKIKRRRRRRRFVALYRDRRGSFRPDFVPFCFVLLPLQPV